MIKLCWQLWESESLGERAGCVVGVRGCSVLVIFKGNVIGFLPETPKEKKQVMFIRNFRTPFDWNLLLPLCLSS